MPRAFAMSWEGGKECRWVKMWKGTRYRVTCSELGLKRKLWNKEASASAANAWWESKRRHLVNVGVSFGVRDGDDFDYQDTSDRITIAKQLGLDHEIQPLQKELERDKSLPVGADRTIDAETAQAVKDFERYSGVSLACVEPRVLRSFLSRDPVWHDRMKRVKKVTKEETLRGATDTWLKGKKDHARERNAGHANASALSLGILKFLDCVGEGVPVSSVNFDLWEKWEKHCETMVSKRDKDATAGWASKTAEKHFKIAKQFVKWLFVSERLDKLPRNFADSKTKRLSRPAKKLTLFTQEEITKLVRAAQGQHRLILLLMLNCGYTQGDIGELLRREVDLIGGRIIRRRSKTDTLENTPEVSYPLWPETLELLEQHIQPSGEFALLTNSGKQWCWEKTDDKGVYHSSDSVASVFKNLRIKLNMFTDENGRTILGKSLKNFRKNSSTLVRKRPGPVGEAVLQPIGVVRGGDEPAVELNG